MNVLQHKKAICDKPIDNIIFNGKNLEVSPLSSGARQGWPFATSFQHSTGSPSRAIRKETEIKRILLQKEKVKLSLVPACCQQDLRKP